MSIKRIYIVEPIGKRGNDDRSRLVRAALPVQAERHVTGKLYRARVPSQDELLELALGGVKVEETADPDEL